MSRKRSKRAKSNRQKPSPKKQAESSESSPQGAEPGQPPVETPGESSSKDQVSASTEVTADGFLSNMPSLSRITSVLMLLVGILVVGLLFYKVMVGFFIPLFLAAAMVVIFRPVHEWFLRRLKGRKRVAAVSTTSVILMIVLLPVTLVVFLAVAQLMGLVRQSDLGDLKIALERGRERFGLKLENADQFRRLDDLAAILVQADVSDNILDEITEAKQLVRFLDATVASETPMEEETDLTLEKLAAFADVTRQLEEASAEDEEADELKLIEQFHSRSVAASSAIHVWINEKLGGSLRAQAKLLTNPSEKDLASAIRATREFLQPRVVKVSGVTGRALIQVAIGLLIMVISIYFFLVDGPAMVRTLMRLSPLDDNYELRLLGEFEKTSRAVVLASALSALVQGILAAFAYHFAGFESFILLFMVTTVMSLIPFLGAASVWVPCSIYLAAVDQRYLAAILMFAYGAAVVSTVDNLIKAYVLHGHSELHPLVALLSVLGGVPVFGPIGILVGPMVVVFLQTLLEILNHELQVRDATES